MFKERLKSTSIQIDEHILQLRRDEAMHNFTDRCRSDVNRYPNKIKTEDAICNTFRRADYNMQKDDVSRKAARQLST